MHENDCEYSIESFGGFKVGIQGQIGDEVWRVADIYIEDGEGIVRLLGFVSAERANWDSFLFEFDTAEPFDEFMQREHRKMNMDSEVDALVRVFMSEYEYKSIGESERREQLEGISLVTGDRYVHSRYMALVCQIDESLVPEDSLEHARTYPHMIPEYQAEALRRSINK